MDPENLVVRLCVAVTQAEFARRLDDARRLSWLAWQIASDEFEACIAAHYVARYQETSEGSLFWNRKALLCAEAVRDDRITAFYPSLYLCLGQAFERIGDPSAAKVYYDLAAAVGLVHSQSSPADTLSDSAS
jgi:hypothetical protein